MLLVAGFGWGRPVYTNPHYFRTEVRTGMAIVAAAGPLSNLVLAMLASLPVRLGLPLPHSVQWFVFFGTLINVTLMVFNLIPVSPLDGFKVAAGFLPAEWDHILIRMERYGPMILMLLILGGQFGFNLLGLLMGPARGVIMKLLGF